MTDQLDLLSFAQNAPGKARRDHPGTSRAAAWAIAPKSGTQRWRVLRCIIVGSKTDEEIQTALGMDPSTERPRRVELVEGGWVCDSGRRRMTSSGRDATVWQATEKARTVSEAA